MKYVQDFIEKKQDEFATHEFFSNLENSGRLGETLAFAPILSFWVMGFQDVLRLNATAVQDRQLKRIARHHLAEDANHDKWFLEDLWVLDGGLPDIRGLFSDAHRTTREATYALISETFLAQEDVERIVILLTLESTGAVFFPRIVEHFRRTGVEPALKYFAQTHLDVEKNHEIVEQQMHDTLGSMEISAETRERCIDLVERSYAAFGRIFDALNVAITDSSRSPEDLENYESALRKRAYLG